MGAALGAPTLGALERLLEAAGVRDLVAVPGGTFVRDVALGRFEGRAAPPLGALLGAGLDARQFTDISGLGPEGLITSREKFFVRTAASAATMRAGAWTLALGGRVQRAVEVRIDALDADVRAAGTHLMECSGNADPANFGLISTARWHGVPLLAVIERVQPLAGAWRVRVTGLDDEVTPSRSSVPGASWIFSRDDLARTGAFLATRMNDAPLMPDHGFPVRLVVPNWYGCACIKWVSQIDLVPDDEPATGHMQEFAARTHQDGVPRLAREFEPPAIDLAAMPIRVEQWRLGERLGERMGGRTAGIGRGHGQMVYRVVGVRWGGAGATASAALAAAGTAAGCALTIRFKAGEPFTRVDRCDPPADTGSTSWTLWSHLWRPDVPGRYQIVLGTSDPSIRTRRLDLRYYTRDVQIDEIYG
jgi:DMSO/TMAO reductase YedYZ molybdopterin-dependent catalytic subunit